MAVRGGAAGAHVVDVPPPTGDGVLVRVTACGVCTSDLHLATAGLPSTLGHEFAGVTPDGTTVAVRPTVPCGRCAECASGRRQLCPEALARTYGVTLDGGMAEEVLVDPSCVFPLPPGLTGDVAPLVEPLAIAVHAVNRAGIRPGESVLVIGAGPIGLCCVAAALAVTPRVDLVARQERRQTAGAALGARIDARDRDYDHVIEAAGSQSALDLAISRARRAGAVTVASTWWDPVSVGVAAAMKEVSIVPAYTYGRHEGVEEFATAIELLANRPQLPEAVISHRLPLADASEAFRIAGDRGTGAIKVLVGL